MEVETLLALSGHGVEALAAGVTKVTVDLGQGRTMPLIAFHHEQLALDGERLVRVCGHTGLAIDDPDLFVLIQQASTFALGGFMTPEPGGQVLFAYTTYVEGLDGDTFGLLCAALAWSVHCMRTGDQRGEAPDRLRRPRAAPSPAADLRAWLRSPEGRPLFAEAPGGLAVLVRITEAGQVSFRAPVEGPQDEDAVEVRLITTEMGLLGEPLVVLCTPLAHVEGERDVTAPLARRLLELGGQVPLGKFFATEDELVLFGHTALARVLTRDRVNRLVTLLAETAMAMPGEIEGEGEGEDA